MNRSRPEQAPRPPLPPFSMQNIGPPLPSRQPAPFNVEWVRRLLEAFAEGSAAECSRLLCELRAAVEAGRDPARRLRWARAIWAFDACPAWWRGVAARGPCASLDLCREALRLSDRGPADFPDCGCSSSGAGCLACGAPLSDGRAPRIALGLCHVTPLEVLLAHPDAAALYREAQGLGAAECVELVVGRAHPRWYPAICAALGHVPRAVAARMLGRVSRFEQIEELLALGAPPLPSLPLVERGALAVCHWVDAGGGWWWAGPMRRLLGSPDLPRALAWLRRRGELVRVEFYPEGLRGLAELEAASARWSQHRAAWVGAVARAAIRRGALLRR